MSDWPDHRGTRFDHDDSLDAAWEDVEAALPEGWHLCAVERHCHAGDEGPGGFYAEAHDRDRWLSEASYGSTPVLALRALAAKLRERPGNAVDRARERWEMALRDELEVDEAHGFPPGYTIDDLIRHLRVVTGADRDD